MADRSELDGPDGVNQWTLPHEVADSPETTAAERRSPWLVWSLWHPTGGAPERQGGSWVGTITALRWFRYVWIVSLNLVVLMWVLHLLLATAYLPVLAFGFGVATALALAVDALAIPIARLERGYVAESLARSVGSRLGHDVASLPLVGVVYDERLEWPPGTFADMYAFLELRPEALVLHGQHRSWALPRSAIEGLRPARYMAGRGHPLVLEGLYAPTLKYRAGSGALKTLSLEWLAGVTSAEVARSSDALRRRLEQWMLDGAHGEAQAPPVNGPKGV